MSFGSNGGTSRRRLSAGSPFSILAPSQSAKPKTKLLRPAALKAAAAESQRPRAASEPSSAPGSQRPPSNAKVPALGRAVSSPSVSMAASSSMAPSLSRSSSGQAADDARVHVVCRVRPVNDIERRRGGAAVAVAVHDGGRMEVAAAKGGGQEVHSFAFDAVFGPSSTQEELFGAVGRPLVEQAFQGFNCTIFAYGQASWRCCWPLITLP